MDFRVSREAFLRVLTHVSSIVDSRSTIPILSNIYIKCDKKEAKLEKINYKKLKKTRLNKYFLIYSEKLIKRLKNDANILLIEKIK